MQIAISGRRLRGAPDAMHGFELVPLMIEDPEVVETSGTAQHTMARRTGRPADVIPGTVFDITPDELPHADGYEVAAVTRVEATLESGLRAWVYVEATSVAAEE